MSDTPLHTTGADHADAHADVDVPSIAARVRAEAGYKVIVTLVLLLVLNVGYFGAQHVSLVAPRRAWSTWIDRVVPFAPAVWVWVYGSMYIMLPLPPLLLTRRNDLTRFACGFAAMACVACFVFVVMPITAPRPHDAASTDVWLYRVLLWLDRPLNCLPSLHIALIVYALLLAGRVTRVGFTASTRTRTLIALWAWGAAITYSTLATKQHWFVDIPTGAALGVIAHTLAWRGARHDPVLHV
ncbi:MAG: phosphatase PAP2 family protein [Phycisphaera sp.]|nr:phosphatase PAP2 family protein [Phycisphaera sp.]